MKLHLIFPTKNGETYLFNKGLLAPLGLMYMAAYTPPDVEIKLIDENVERIDFSDVPDLVGITTMTATAARCYEVADTYRALGAKVVLGGVHASMLPEEALEHCDSVVVGEGENLWENVVEDARAGRLEPVYKCEAFTDFKHPRPPRRDLIDPKRYWSANNVQTARGCPHNCNFCSVTAFNGKRLRAREVDDVLAEVESLPRNNLLRTKVVPFVDDNIGAIPSRSKKLFKELIPMKLLWGSQASITIAKDEELVALAAESGCHFMFIGLETMSNSALEAMGKHQNKIEDYAEALRLLRKYKIHVMGAFVFGFDTDSATVHDDTLAFAMENKVHVAQFADLTPYPGTKLYFQLKDEERLEPAYWMDPESCGRVVYEPKHTSGAVLRSRTQALHREFYSYKSIFKRMMPPHKHWSYWLAFNLLYRQTIVANRSSDLDAPEAV